MLAIGIPSQISPAALVRQLRYYSTEQLHRQRRKAVAKATLLKRVIFTAGVVATPLTGALAVYGSFWLGAGMALGVGGLIGRSLRRMTHNREQAGMLELLSSEQLETLRALAGSSDVVKVSLAEAEKSRRALCRVDLMYARALIVRESRNGNKPSDLLPLERTRGMLAPMD